MIILGIICAGFGLLLIFARDFMWSLTEMGNSMAGRKSERTELWEAGQVISGVIMIVIGAGIVCVGVGEAQTEAREDTEATATATTRLTMLNDIFADRLDDWSAEAELNRVYRVNPRDLGITADYIFYGRCSNERFFLFVGNLNNTFFDYAWTDAASPDACKPPDVYVGNSNELGNNWHMLLSFFADADDFYTRTPFMTLIPTRTPTPARTPTATVTPKPTRTPLPGATVTPKRTDP